MIGNVISAVINFLTKILLSPWLWAAAILALLLFLAVCVYRRKKLRALGMLEYDRSFSDDGVFAGDSFEFTEQIYNPTMFPLFFVRMDFFMPAGFTVDNVECREYTKISSLFNIPPRAAVTKTHTVRADIRGHYSLETSSIRYRGNEFLFSVPFDVYVYPKCIAAAEDSEPDLYRAGNSIAARKYIEDPFFMSGIRPYQSGDAMRSINFKASVRSFSGGVRRLMTNNYDSSRHYNCMILLDMSSYTDNEESKEQMARMERGLEHACFLLSQATSHGGRAGFAANCSAGARKYIKTACSSGSMHVTKVLRCLSEVSYFARRECSFDALIMRIVEDMDVGTDLYLITPFVDDKTADTVRRLQSGGVNVCLVTLK